MEDEAGLLDLGIEECVMYACRRIKLPRRAMVLLGNSWEGGGEGRLPDLEGKAGIVGSSSEGWMQRYPECLDLVPRDGNCSASLN
jgi:hypothetical protein